MSVLIINEMQCDKFLTNALQSMRDTMQIVGNEGGIRKKT